MEYFHSSTLQSTEHASDAFQVDTRKPRSPICAMQLISSNLLPIPIVAAQDESAAGLPIEFGLNYCPSMDLVAVYPRTLPSKHIVTATESTDPEVEAYGEEDDDELIVDVYRLNGQKAFTTTIDSDSRTVGIVDLAWREDGIVLAITTTDNRVRLVNTFSGKIVHTFTSMSDRLAQGSQKATDGLDGGFQPTGKRKTTIGDSGPRKRQCLPTSVYYSTHLSNPEATKSRLATINEENGRVLDDLLGLHVDLNELLQSEADLPKELASIDVEQYLPKLPTLQASGISEDDVFTTRMSIDAILHASKDNTRSGSTDIVTIAQDDANVHIRIFDSFAVGDVDLNSALSLPTGCTLSAVRRIVTHPLSETIYVIAEEHQGSSPSKLRRQARSQTANVGNRLHLLSLDLHFLQQSSLGLPVLATKATQLHNLIRYLRQIERQLAREIKSAFDLPSRFIRTLEEDLKEQDGEGSTFQTSSYHALLTGEVNGKFKEWLVDILGDRGVKRWEKAVAECLENVRKLMNESWNPAVERAGVSVSRLMGLVASGTFQVDRTTLEGLRNTIDVMAVIGEDLVREVNTEITGFTAFIAWLKREVEAAGLEDTSEKLEEMRESSDHSQVRKVLKYISERLQHTTVKKYIHDEAGAGAVPGDMEDNLSFYDTFRESRRNSKGQVSPPSMKFLTSRLGMQCDGLFHQVARQLQDNVLVEHVCVLGGPWSIRAMDCRILFEPEYPVLNIFAADVDGKGGLQVIQRSLGQGQGSTRTKTVMLEASDEVLDVKCADDETIFVLVRKAKVSKILSVRLENGLEAEVSIRHVFGGAEDSFIKLGLSPWRIDVNGRKGRRTLTVLDEQGRGYGVFDLDSGEAGPSGADDEVMSG